MLSMDSARPKLRSWTPAETAPACRLCGARLHRTLIDLGECPLANRTIAPDAADDPPHTACTSGSATTARWCSSPSAAPPEAAATPRSAPARPLRRLPDPGATHYAETMRKRLRLGADSLVIEIGCHDGTLLRPFQAAGIPVLGIDPAPDPATDIPTEIASFNTGTAMEVAVRRGCADLVVANGVLPYAPDLFDFAAGLACILRPNGMLSLQVPHLLSLVQTVQFDAFRHDAYTYLSLRVLEHVLRSVGLRVFDAERAAGSRRPVAGSRVPRRRSAHGAPGPESRSSGRELRRTGPAGFLFRLQRPGRGWCGPKSATSCETGAPPAAAWPPTARRPGAACC